MTWLAARKAPAGSVSGGGWTSSNGSSCWRGVAAIAQRAPLCGRRAGLSRLKAGEIWLAAVSANRQHHVAGGSLEELAASESVISKKALFASHFLRLSAFLKKKKKNGDLLPIHYGSLSANERVGMARNRRACRGGVKTMKRAGGLANVENESSAYGRWRSA
jgi:hypothetical protein